MLALFDQIVRGHPTGATRRISVQSNKKSSKDKYNFKKNITPRDAAAFLAPKLGTILVLHEVTTLPLSVQPHQVEFKRKT